jgi:hypothetical protein
MDWGLTGPAFQSLFQFLANSHFLWSLLYRVSSKYISLEVPRINFSLVYFKSVTTPPFSFCIKTFKNSLFVDLLFIYLLPFGFTQFV